jgi:D-glycero-alpha-D-manno-heptose-7-phosphate kinase
MNPGDAQVRVSAPVRLDFAGGWTDVASFAMRERGVVVNAAIELRTTVSVAARLSGYEFAADDLDLHEDAATLTDLRLDGTLDLHKAAARHFEASPCTIRSVATAPPGSGLGTSGALSVALVAALDNFAGRTRDPLALADEAWRLETVDAAVAGGKQDQYAAALGGFRLMTFDADRVAAQALAVDPHFARELAAHTLLCHTGASRFSGATIRRVMRAYENDDDGVGAALRSMADIAAAMAGALLRGSLSEIGGLLSDNWREQQQLDAGMCTAQMAHLEAAVVQAGAAGGKAAGSGAGGAMFFVIPGDVGPARAAAERCGAVVLPVEWAVEGVRNE